MKETAYIGGGPREPTVLNPRIYKNRFREAMSRCTLVTLKFFLLVLISTFLFRFPARPRPVDFSGGNRHRSTFTDASNLCSNNQGQSLASCIDHERSGAIHRGCFACPFPNFESALCAYGRLGSIVSQLHMLAQTVRFVLYSVYK